MLRNRQAPGKLFSGGMCLQIKTTFGEKDKIQIEVRCAASVSGEEFRFFVSKPGWKAALDNIESYFFYCWADTNLHR